MAPDLSRCILGAGFAFVLVVQGHTVELNPPALVYQLPDQIRWNPPSAEGVQNAVLVGDPSKPGLYLQRTKWLKGNHFSRPHFHPNDRFITVLAGTWWMGSGTNFDPENGVPLPTGTFVTHFGKEVHWDGAKTEDASLLIFGEGPGTSTQVAPTAGKFSGLDPKAVVYTSARPASIKSCCTAIRPRADLTWFSTASSREISASLTSTPTTASSP